MKVEFIEPEINDCVSDAVEELTAKVESLELNTVFTCDHCGSGFVKEGNLKRHLEKKHAVLKVGTVCTEWEKVFANRRLWRST